MEINLIDLAKINSKFQMGQLIQMIHTGESE